MNRYNPQFRGKPNCETAIHCILDDSIKAVDRKELIWEVLPYLHGILETVDRKRFIIEIKSFGAMGNALLWIVSYNNNRNKN